MDWLAEDKINPLLFIGLIGLLIAGLTGEFPLGLYGEHHSIIQYENVAACSLASKRVGWWHLLCKTLSTTRGLVMVGYRTILSNGNWMDMECWQ